MNKENEIKIARAKKIIAQIFCLSIYHSSKENHNWELNKASDAMYAFIKEIESEELTTLTTKK